MPAEVVVERERKREAFFCICMAEVACLEGEGSMASPSSSVVGCGEGKGKEGTSSLERSTFHVSCSTLHRRRFFFH